MDEADEVLTVDFALAEIARKYRRENLDAEAIRERLAFIAEHTSVLTIDTELALRAADTWLELHERSRRRKLKRTPALANAVMLAAARRAGAKILSGDPHFEGLEEALWPAP